MIQFKFSENWNRIKQFIKKIVDQIQALYIASRDPRTSWWTKLLIAGLLAYALSPIDLIPDFIPILGYLDDFILLPLGIYLVSNIIPEDLWQECLSIAKESRSTLPKSRKAAVVIGFIWFLTFIAVSVYMWNQFGRAKIDSE